ncbi:MAG: sel1 repeat family protein [Proteobacteria bacterium]|nr:sel1 repeat family protein [Pseudomonadota bacterium]
MSINSMSRAVSLLKFVINFINKKIEFTKAAKSVFVLGLICFLVLLPFTAGACGWAGDGESDENGEGTIWVGAEGKPIEEQTNPIDDPKFQTRIGNSYRKAKDYIEAVRWFRMAASQGFESAQNNLAAMYEQGLGIARSDVLAAQWYLLAAEQGNAKAQHSLGQMYLEGRGVQPDKQLASKWILKSAENGHVSAMKEIADMFWEGQGVLKNDIKAYEWWKLSSMHGDGSSDNSLEMAKTKMDIKAIATAEKSFAVSHIPLKKQTVLGLYLTAKAGYEKWKKILTKSKL